MSEHDWKPGAASELQVAPTLGAGEPNVVKRVINAWDCCGTCAGGVLAQHVREQIDAALEAAAVQVMQADTGDEGEWAETYEDAARIVRAQKRGA